MVWTCSSEGKINIYTDLPVKLGDHVVCDRVSETFRCQALDLRQGFLQEGSCASCYHCCSTAW
jgi:hypothetical protein